MNKLFLFILLGFYSGVALALPPSFNFSGTLMDVTGTSPLLDTSIVMRFDILDSSKTCVLYEETQTINTAMTNGAFSVMVGSAQGATQRTGTDPGLSLAAIFQNSLSPIGCYSAPVITDGRYMRVNITPSSSGTQETLSPDFYIASVPMAMTAQTLEGNSTIQGGVTLANSGQLNFSTSGGNAGIRAPTSLTSAYTLTLPTSAGSSGQLLTTDGAGNLSWSSMPNIPTSLGSGMLVGNASGATGAPVAVSLQQLMDTDLGSAVGAIAYRGTSGWTVLPPAAAGYLLTSTGAVPQWQMPAPAVTPTGVAAGTYTKVTVNSSGAVTTGAALTAADIPFAIVNGGNNGAVPHIGTSDSNDVQLMTNGTARMVISATGNIGIGTSTPTAMLDARTVTPSLNAIFASSNATSAAAIYASSTGSSSAAVYGTSSGSGAGGYFASTTSTPALAVSGHIVTLNNSGTTSLSSCTGGSISGNDTRGSVSYTASGSSMCTISFAVAYAAAPICVVSWGGSGSTYPIYVSGTTSTTLTVGIMTGTPVSGNVFNYICMQ